MHASQISDQNSQISFSQNPNITSPNNVRYSSLSEEMINYSLYNDTNSGNEFGQVQNGPTGILIAAEVSNPQNQGQLSREESLETSELIEDRHTAEHLPVVEAEILVIDRTRSGTRYYESRL